MARKFTCTCALGLFGLVAACSDPAPPAGQGAASLYLNTTNAVVGSFCPASVHWVNVPFAKAGGQQTSATAKGALAVDGEAEMGVTCSVRANGSAFDVAADLRSPAFDTTTTPPTPVNPTIIAIQTNIADDQAGAQGTVSVKDAKSGTEYGSSACTFTVKHVNPSDALGVAPGRFWASVACPSVRDSLNQDPMAVCQIGPGFVVLENCAQ